MINIITFITTIFLAIPIQILCGGSFLFAIEYLFYSKKEINLVNAIIFIFISFTYDYYLDIPLGVYQILIFLGLLIIFLSEKFVNLENKFTNYLVIFISVFITSSLLKIVVFYGSLSTIFNIFGNNLRLILIESFVTLVIYFIIEKIDNILSKEKSIDLKVKNK